MAEAPKSPISTLPLYMNQRIFIIGDLARLQHFCLDNRTGDVGVVVALCPENAVVIIFPNGRSGLFSVPEQSSLVGKAGRCLELAKYTFHGAAQLTADFLQGRFSPVFARQKRQEPEGRGATLVVS